jgi:hypothetical protein
MKMTLLDIVYCCCPKADVAEVAQINLRYQNIARLIKTREVHDSSIDLGRIEVLAPWPCFEMVLRVNFA